MIEDLRPFGHYQSMASRWSPRVPSHWELRKMRTLITPRNERNRSDLPLLSVAREKGVFVRSIDDDNHNVIPHDLTNYKVARAGSLVINKMKAWQGSMGIAPCDGIVSPAYFVYDLAISNGAFGQALLRSRPYVAHFGQASDGVRIGQWDLSIARMREIPLAIPPADEQSAIVRFLGHANYRIECYIRQKRKLITLLNEQRQALIHRAVTRGLHPNVTLKDSEVWSLGDVPTHWDVRPFVRCTTERADYRGATPEKVDSGAFLVTAKNIRKGWIDYETSQEYVRHSEYLKIMRRGLPKLGDVLLTTEAPLGNVALVDREDIALAQRIIRFRLNPDILLPRFAVFCLNSAYFQNQLAERATGSTAKGIKASKLPQLIVALPPTDEQREIIAVIDRNVSPINETLTRAEREIALMREYRARLVADVVTGQLDVREAARCLPTEEPESVAVEDGDVLEDEEPEEGAA